MVAWTEFRRHLFFTLHIARLFINNLLTVQTYGGAETNNEFQGDIGAEL